MSVAWHIASPEFPPECGGVGDYVAQLAGALAAGAGRVTVWVAPSPAEPEAVPGVEIVKLPDRFGAGSRQALDARLASDGGRSRLLVQYVANTLGRRGANLSFASWIAGRARHGHDVRVMFHEPYLYYRWRPDHFAVAVAQRWMARTIVGAAPRLYLSTATWRRYLARYGPDAVARAEVLPIPSAVPLVNAPGEVAATRARLLGAATRLVGHFGTYGDHVAPLLEKTLAALLADDRSASAVCVGRRSDRFVASLVGRHPSLAGRVTGSGQAPARDVSLLLQACDLLVQPYPDGVTTRRTSVMAGLCNAVPVVTNEGPLTEPLWTELGAAAIAPSALPAPLAGTARRLLDDRAGLQALAARGRAAYDAHFALHHTVAALTRSGESVDAAG